MTTEQVRVRLLALLAEVLELDPGRLSGLDADTPLFGEGLGLDSLTGMRLLAAIQRELGVDVAGRDLDLACLETVGTLTEEVAAAVAERA